MDKHLQKMHLRRILAGEIRCTLPRGPVILTQPTSSLLSEAEALYVEIAHEASFIAPSEDELHTLILNDGLWTENEEEELDRLPVSMEAVRVEAWQAHLKFQGKRVDRCRKQIKKMITRWSELYGKRHLYDYVSPFGIASMARVEFLIYVLSGSGHFNLLEMRSLVSQYYTTQLTDTNIRELSKSNAARSLWASSKAGSLIPGSSAGWNDEQVGLISWLSLYDNIHESIDCPPTDIVNDDLLIDGWLILQSRTREKDKATKLMGDDAHKGSNKPGLQEVYIPADTSEDAQRIHDMNDTQTRFQKRQREKMIATHGEVDETKMPDSQLAMRQQALQEILDKSKRR